MVMAEKYKEGIWNGPKKGVPGGVGNIVFLSGEGVLVIFYCR